MRSKRECGLNFALLLLPFYLGGFGLGSALGTEFCSRGEFELAARAFCLFLCRAAFRAELCSLAKVSSALNTRNLRDLHLAAALGAEFS
jgi:hypothetical protein